MKSVIKDYFAFNKSERRGLVVLCSLLTLLIASNFAMPLLVKQENFDFSEFIREVEAFEKESSTPVKQKKNYNSNNFGAWDVESASAEAALTPFEFNPNDMTTARWKALGLSDRQIRTLTNYTSKGGKFRKREDFKKMYCISEKEYNILEPYIIIPEQAAETQKTENQFTENKSFEILEINTAIPSELDALPGIGAYFAEKIVEYRNKLGGFYTLSQLMEVPRMDSARYLSIAPMLSVNPRAVRKMNVNTAGFDELKKHPYIGYNIALSLTNYREKHGKFKTIEEIKNSALITEKVYARISPYLRTD